MKTEVPNADDLPKWDSCYRTLQNQIEYHEREVRALRELKLILYPNGYKNATLSADLNDVLVSRLTRPIPPQR